MAHSLALTLSLLLFSFFTVPSASQSSSKFTAIFSFGDSLIDTGTNNYIQTELRADHPPYGRDFPGHTATGRFSNGLMIPDLLAANLGIKQLVPPFLDPKLTPNELKTGVNFASAGAGYDELTSTYNAGTLPVSRQVKNFEAYVSKLKGSVGENEANRILGSSLTLFSSGSNDFAINIFAPVPSPRKAQYGVGGYQDFLLKILEGTLKQLYDLGLRKFIIAGVPPFGCMPINIAKRFTDPLLRKCVFEEISAAAGYNSKLQNLLPRVQQSLVGSKIVYLDFYNNLLDMIDNPAKYGFVETGRGCCGTGTVEIGPLCTSMVPICPDASKFAFFDGVHPTEKVYRVITQQIMQQIIPQF